MLNTGNQLSILSAIVSSSEDAIISKGLDGVITSWNPAAELIFGYSAAEAIGNKISIIIPDNLLDEEKSIISRIKDGEKIQHYETIRRRKDGSTFPVAITVSPIKNARGIITGASKIARDISERHLFEEKQALLSSIVESSEDAIISKNLDGIITSWNKGAEIIFGYKATEAIGKHISLIIPTGRLYEELTIIQKIKNGEQVPHFDTVRCTKSGKEIDVSITVSPVRNGQQKVTGASKIARNITERKELEQQRKLLMENLQRLNEYKDDFMAMASHELKTPLTVVKANLQVLELKLNTEDQKKHLEKAVANLDKLSRLISDLLDEAKIQAGKLALNLTKFDFAVFLTEAIKNIQLTSTQHILKLDCDAPPTIIKADRDRLEQVIINILTNATKYSPGKSEVTIRASVVNNCIVTSVTDQGIGIPAEDIKHIFTRFYRVRGTAATFSGSGIGLYVSEQIIQRHEGKIWAISEMGKGSVFHFSLPLPND